MFALYKCCISVDKMKYVVCFCFILFYILNLLALQDVVFLPSKASFSTTFLLNCGASKSLRATTCLKTVVGGKQGHAPCKIPYLQQSNNTFVSVDFHGDHKTVFQIGAGLYAVGRPVQKRNEEDGQIGTNQSLPLERWALFNRFLGMPAHGPPHVAGGASGPIGGCRDESRTDNPDLDLRHVFDRNNRKTDLI